MSDSEMENRYVQVDLDTFFNDYVPIPTKQLDESQLEKIGDFSHVPYSGAEDAMYAPLCETFRKLQDAIGSPCTMYDTSNRTDRANAMQDMKPDLSLYDGENGLSKYVIDEDERKSSTVREEGRRPYLGRTAWAWMTSFIEVKSATKWAPFNFDDSGKFEVKDTDLGRRARAQVTKYVTEIRLRQHRTFVLCAFVWRDWVRFMRWDQAGAIVSAADNYVKDPRRLLDFVHGISTPSREGWGYDPTVTLVNHNDAAVKSRIDQIRESLPTNSYLANVFAESFGGDMDDYPLYEVKCEDVPYRAENRATARERAPDTPRTSSYWISKIHAGSRSPTGRGMKGYVAIDVDHGQLVFLKDYWCPVLAGIHPELETYARLRQFRVKHVATALAGGEVFRGDGQRQTTVTQILLEAPRDEHFVAPPEAFHYRFVVREVGKPLEEHVSPYHLWCVIGLAIIGHQNAYENARVLHRDISVKNIMINPISDIALIIDWDLAKYVDTDTELEGNQSGRAGTLPFMSAKLLQLPKKPNDLADDLESFVHVLCFMILCYHAHSMSPTNIAGSAREFTPDANTRNATLLRYLNNVLYSHTGRAKLSHNEIGSAMFKPEDPHLKEGLNRLYELLQRHYQVFPIDDALRAQWGIQVLPAPKLIRAPMPGLIAQHDELGLAVAQEASKWPSSSLSSSTSTSSAPPPNNATEGFLGLNTHKHIRSIFFGRQFGLQEVWSPTSLKTDSQFVGLFNPDGGEGTGLTSSLTGSSARNLKHPLDSDEGDRDNKRIKVKGSSRVEQGGTKSGAGVV